VVFEGCNARRGGALGCADSSPIVEDCVFRGNSALNDGGAALIINFSDPVLARCVITGNSARIGGGVAIDLGAPILRECTVASNEATEAGGGIYVERDVVTSFERLLLAANCAPVGPDLALSESTSDVTLDCCALSDAGLAQGPGSITEVGGRVLTDPLLCLPAPCSNAPHQEGEYGLAAASPCLPGASPCGLLIGALGEECGVPTGIGGDDPEIRVEEASWGEIKSMFGHER
jgi:predicted outer membrane repeat protein